MMPARSLHTYSLVFIAVMMTGCADAYVRETTQTLADDVASLQRDVTRYATAQQDGAARRVDAIMKQRRQVADGDEEVTLQLGKLPGAQDLYTTVLSNARETIAREKSLTERMLNERLVLKSSQTKFDPQVTEQLEILSSKLKELGTLPSLKARGEFLFEYFQSTAKEVGKLEKATKESTDKAEAATSGSGR